MSVQAHATARTAARSRLATLRGSSALLLLALFAGAALISGFTILRGGAPFDEGLVLQAARRVTEGQLPYRDFLWAYGPAQPYVLGGLFDVLGPSLLSWRIPRVLLDAGVATTVYALVRREVSLPLALAAWLAAACAMAQPTSATPFPAALLPVLLAVGAVTRVPPRRGAPILAGVLCVVAAAWRIDFAVYGAGAVVVALALQPGRRRALAAFSVTALLGTLALYLPFAVAVGPADLWDALIGTSLRERDWWTLPFPISYDGGLRAWPPSDLVHGGKDVLGFYVAVVLVGGMALVAAAAAGTLARVRRLSPRLAALVVLGFGCLLYLLSRPDEFHVTPLVVVLAAAIPLALAELPEGAFSRARVRRSVIGGLTVALGLLLAYGLLNRASALLQPPRLATIRLPAADGAEAPPSEARALERMVAGVQRRVAPGEPIYAVTRRSDLVRLNQPLIYVLTDRDNPTNQDFGLLATPAAQRRTVAELDRVRPRVVVRWTDPISVVREPNLRGKPSGSRQLDHWLTSRYRLAERAGYYELLVPRR